MTQQLTESQAIEEREKYVLAFNQTMLNIWREKITLLDVIECPRRKSREGQPHLLDTLVSLPVRADGRFFEVSLSQQFLEYGIWQDYGTGRETPRGNSGDIGRTKVRQKRRWFSVKYYASVMNIKDFFADNLGRQFQGVLADTIQQRYR